MMNQKQNEDFDLMIKVILVVEVLKRKEGKRKQKVELRNGIVILGI